MKVPSLIRDRDRLVPAEVEVTLLPGLPQIQVLGLPDQGIRESLHRIRSALRHQGFQFPRAKQILVNIRPVQLRKSSAGLELAIAAGIIWASGQRPAPTFAEGCRFYGELDLGGKVYEPEDLVNDFLGGPGDLVFTGTGGGGALFGRARLSCLADLENPVIEKQADETEPLPPSFGFQRNYTEREARLLALVGLGEHHLLLAGACGGGKSTLAKSVPSFVAPPTEEDWRQRIVDRHWRPVVAPHHSTSELSLIGGGVPPRPGEISRAHRGVLILDELLEFPVKAQEALREPMEEKRIRIVRGLRAEEFPADVLVVATMNLCPCGLWQPGKEVSCCYSARRCRSVVERISGPFFDRFEVAQFSEGRKSERRIPGVEISQWIQRAREFRSLQSQKVEERLSRFWVKELGQLPFSSERRKLSTLRVAASLADLEGQKSISTAVMEEALELACKNFEKLRLGPGV